MTAEQLIAILQKMPQDNIVEIEIRCPGWYEIHPIESVKVFADKTIRIA